MPIDVEDEEEQLDLEAEDELSGDLQDNPVTELSEEDAQFIAKIIDKIWIFTVKFTAIDMFPYQEEFGRRIIESVLLEDGETITCEQSRQSGKTEVVANVVSSLMVLLPKLAEMFPTKFSKYSRGFWVGCFAPVENQVETLFGRIVDRLTSESALEIFDDPEIDDTPKSGGAKFLKLKKSGSFVRMQTANPRAKIESKSYHLIIVDEAQGVEERVINKALSPMLAFYLGSMVMTGTPDVVKGAFYKTIQYNKRLETKRGSKKNHFHFDWKYCARFNPRYKTYIRKEALRIGEDSDEFNLNYNLVWLLERGMFVTATRMNELGDPSMQIMHSWWKTPVVAGIDPARRIDSTVVTVVWVDWDHPDEDGLFDHRILDWLEIHGEAWEEQYFQIVDFLNRFNVLAVAVDSQGMGDVVADRLSRLLPRTQVVALDSTKPSQSNRWKHLQTLIQKGLISWPAHAKARRTRVWKRFYQQMCELEKKYDSQYLIAEAPDEREAHDDHPDALALACVLTKEFMVPEAEMTTAPWSDYRRR